MSAPFDLHSLYSGVSIEVNDFQFSADNSIVNSIALYVDFITLADNVDKKRLRGCSAREEKWEVFDIFVSCWGGNLRDGDDISSWKQRWFF